MHEERSAAPVLLPDSTEREDVRCGFENVCAVELVMYIACARCQER
jgi:hypothetical protein